MPATHTEQRNASMPQAGGTAPAATVTVQVSRRYAAPVEHVFDAWLTPERAERFLFVTPGGQMVHSELDAHVGGNFNFTERRDGVEVEHIGEFLEIEPGRRLVFTFGVPLYSSLMTTVALDFAAVPGGCEITLTHQGVLAEYRERTAEGWGKILAGLERAL
ncbi:MAG TPA: SRPBCC domain-containing protein [Burkholderiales bacterium]